MMNKKALRNKMNFLNNSKYHVKSYKSKKMWLFAGLFALALGGSALTAGANSNVHADSTNNANSNNNVDNTNVRKEPAKSTLVGVGQNNNNGQQANANKQVNANNDQSSQNNAQKPQATVKASNKSVGISNGANGQKIVKAPTVRRNAKNATPFVNFSDNGPNQPAADTNNDSPSENSKSNDNVAVTGDKIYGNIPIAIRVMNPDGTFNRNANTVYINTEALANDSNNYNNNPGSKSTSLNVGDTYYINPTDSKFRENVVDAFNPSLDPTDYGQATNSNDNQEDNSFSPFTIKFADDGNGNLVMYKGDKNGTFGNDSEIATFNNGNDVSEVPDPTSSNGYAEIIKNFNFNKGNTTFPSATKSQGQNNNNGADGTSSSLALDYAPVSHDLHVLYENQDGDMLDPSNGDVITYSDSPGNNSGTIQSTTTQKNGQNVDNSGQAVPYTDIDSVFKAINTDGKNAGDNNGTVTDFDDYVNNQTVGDSGNITVPTNLQKYNFKALSKPFDPKNYSAAGYSNQLDGDKKYVILRATNENNSTPTVPSSGYTVPSNSKHDSDGGKNNTNTNNMTIKRGNTAIEVPSVDKIPANNPNHINYIIPNKSSDRIPTKPNGSNHGTINYDGSFVPDTDPNNDLQYKPSKINIIFKVEDSGSNNGKFLTNNGNPTSDPTQAETFTITGDPTKNDSINKILEFPDSTDDINNSKNDIDKRFLNSDNKDGMPLPTNYHIDNSYSGANVYNGNHQYVYFPDTDSGISTNKEIIYVSNAPQYDDNTSDYVIPDTVSSTVSQDKDPNGSTTDTVYPASNGKNTTPTTSGHNIQYGVDSDILSPSDHKQLYVDPDNHDIKITTGNSNTPTSKVDASKIPYIHANFDIKAEVQSNNAGGQINAVNVPVDVTLSPDQAKLGQTYKLSGNDIKAAIVHYALKNGYQDYYGNNGDLNLDSIMPTGGNSEIDYKFVKASNGYYYAILASNNNDAGNYRFTPGRMYVNYVGTAYYHDASNSGNNADATKTQKLDSLPVEGVIAEGYDGENVMPIANKDLRNALNAQGWQIDEGAFAEQSQDSSNNPQIDDDDSSYTNYQYNKGMQIGLPIYDQEYTNGSGQGVDSYSNDYNKNNDYKSNDPTKYVLSSSNPKIDVNTVPTLTGSTLGINHRDEPSNDPNTTPPQENDSSADPSGKNDANTINEGKDAGINPPAQALAVTPRAPQVRVSRLATSLTNAAKVLAAEPSAAQIAKEDNIPGVTIPVTRSGETITDNVRFLYNGNVIDHGTLNSAKGTKVDLSNLKAPIGYQYINKPGIVTFDNPQTIDLNVTKYVPQPKHTATITFKYYDANHNLVGTKTISGVDGQEVPEGSYNDFKSALAAQGLEVDPHYTPQRKMYFGDNYDDNIPVVKIPKRPEWEY